MHTTPGWTPTLRYSPVNGMIVDWGHDGVPFALCGLPQCAEERHPIVHHHRPHEHCETPAIEAVDTYDWYRWVPEIIVGISDASEDMAASYARRAAIEFATKTRCLQRYVPVTLQPGVDRYPISPFEQERAKGIVSVESARGECRHGASPRTPRSSALQDVGGPFVHASSQEIRFMHPQELPCPHHHHHHKHGLKHLLVKVWVAPSEDACAHDALLWDEYRSEITRGARAMMIEEAYSFGAYKTSRGTANFRGDSLMINRATAMLKLFEQDMLCVKAAVSTNGDLQLRQAPNLFAGRVC